MPDFPGRVRASRASRGPSAGQPVPAAHAKTILVNAGQFYLFMHGNGNEAAAAAGNPGWREPGAGHAGFCRTRELPRPGRRDPALDIIGDAAMTPIMAGTGMPGDSAAAGGLEDPQAMRIMMLQARPGRRINEILMLDADPLLPLAPGPQSAAGPGALTAGSAASRPRSTAPRAPSRSMPGSPRSSGRSRNGPPPGWRRTPRRARGPATCSPACCSTATPTGPACRRPSARLSPSRPAGPASATARPHGRLPARPPVPARQGHQPAQRRRPGSPRAALSRASPARHDHALRADPGRNP